MININEDLMEQNETNQATSNVARIGLIGLVNIGQQFAFRLIDQNICEFHISNRDMTRTIEKAAAGGIVDNDYFMETNDEVLRQSDIVFVALPKAQIQKEFTR